MAAELADRLSSATNLWQAACALLSEWRERLPGDGGARGDNGDRYLAWSDLVGDATGYFDHRPTFDDAALGQVLAWTSDGDDLDAVDAVAWGMDTAGAPSFPSSWRDELRAGGRHRLAEGTLYPVADASQKLFPDLPMSSRPAALSPPRLDELPHVRAHVDEGVDIVVDFSREADLEKVGTGLGLLAALHPNQRDDEFEWPAGRIVFPVRLKDEAEQERRVLELLDRALAHKARIVVLPELAATSGLEAQVAARLEDVESQHLVVLGSRHTGEGTSAQNLATALLPEAEPIVHAKIVPFSDELHLAPPWKEGINVPARPTLTIYPADRFRFCILICKDLLDQRMVRILARLGVNVLAVPAMSKKTDAYPGRVDQLVADAQAIAVVANNPLSWKSKAVDPIAIFGQPVAASQVVTAVAGDQRAPALTLFRVGDSAAYVGV